MLRKGPRKWETAFNTTNQLAKPRDKLTSFRMASLVHEMSKQFAKGSTQYRETDRPACQAATLCTQCLHPQHASQMVCPLTQQLEHQVLSDFGQVEPPICAGGNQREVGGCLCKHLTTQKWFSELRISYNHTLLQAEQMHLSIIVPKKPRVVNDDTNGLAWGNRQTMEGEAKHSIYNEIKLIGEPWW